MASAKRTAVARRAAADRGLPLVVRAFRAFPPGFLVRTGHDLVGSKATVLYRMPLGSQFGVHGSQ